MRFPFSAQQQQTKIKKRKSQAVWDAQQLSLSDKCVWIRAGTQKKIYEFDYNLDVDDKQTIMKEMQADLLLPSDMAALVAERISNELDRYVQNDDDDVSFYNSTASTWTLATPRTTWE